MRKWIVPLLLVHLGASQTGAYEVNEMVNIYASLRPEVIFRSAEGGDAVRRMDDGYSRVGLKGRVDLSETLWGYYKYERRMSSNDGQSDGAVRSDNNELRQVHVGIGGRLGTLAIGRHYGQYYDVIDDELDRHRSHYSDAVVFGDLFVSNALLYLTPAKGPLHGGLLIELNDADTQGESIDERVEITASIRDRGAALHFGYVNSPFHDGLFGVSASYGAGSVKVAGVFQRFERSSARTDKLYSGAVDYDLSPKDRLRLAVTKKDDGLDPDMDEIYVISGGEHRFDEHFIVWVEFFRKSTKVKQAGDESAVVLGMRFDF